MKLKLYIFKSLMTFCMAVMMVSVASAQAVNTDFGPATGNFVVEFDVVPSHAPMNAGVGVSDIQVGTWGDMSAIVGFRADGFIDAYNSTGYEAVTVMTYAAGTSYHVAIAVDGDAQTYSVEVTPAGDTVATTIATDYGYRHAATEINNYVSWNDDNTTFGGVVGATLDITNFSFVSIFNPSKADIVKTDSAPVIDGDASDWDSYEAHAIDFDANGAGSSATDFSGYWKATWTDTELYLMAEVNDDSLFHTGAPNWNHDAINFYIGVNEKNGLGASNDPNKNLYNYWWDAGDGNTIGSVDTASQYTAVSKWDKADGSGYIIEWSISFDELKLGGQDITFEKGTSFLLDVVAVDDDSEIDNYNIWGWSFDGSSWTNMDNVGVVTLVNPPFPTKSANIVKAETAPVIDGDASDWDSYEAHAIAYDADGAGSSATDFSGYWKATWSDTELYLMAEINDDSLYNEGGNPFWNHDAINFFIGVNGRNGLGASNDSHKNMYNYWWGEGDANSIGSVDPESTPTAVSKWDKADGSGYIIEWSISFDELKLDSFDIDFKDGTSFLFDVTAVDDDSEIDNFNVWGWSFDGSSWTNMDNTGDVKLRFNTKSANITKAATSPMIDGDASDWESYEAHAIAYDADMAGSSATDFSGYWKATWDDTELYLMAEINDDSLYNEGGNPFWNHDAINFFIGVNGRNGLGASNDANKNMYNYWWGEGDSDVIGSVDPESTPTAVSKWDKADGSGYIIEWSISFEELKLGGYDINFENGTEFLLDVTAVDDDSEIDNFNVWGWSFDGSSWTNMDNTGDVKLTPTPFPTKTTKIYKAESAPVIDGDAADWAGVQAHPIAYDADMAGSGATDFSGYWKATWSDNELYLMAEINDDTLYNEGGNPFWNHDAINFFIGVNGRNGLGASNDIHKNMYNYWWGEGDADAIGSVDPESTPTAVSKWDKADGSGYIIEWSISFDELKFGGYDITFEDGTSFLLDVTAVDDDSEIDNFNVWGWSFDGSSWTNMDNTGDVTISDITTATVEIVAPTFNLYPNPTSQHLFIDNFTNANELHIFNMQGQKLSTYNVNSNNTSAKLDISSLSPGTYILMVKGENTASVKRFVKM